MQPTTVALGAGAALGVAFLMSRATGEGEEEVEDFGARVSDYGPRGPGATNPRAVVAPEPSAPPMTGSTLEEWMAEQQRRTTH